MADQATATEMMTMPKHGEFCWTEIAGNDLEANKKFYAEIFGWELKPSTATGGEIEYQEFSAGRSYSAGGMYQIDEARCEENNFPVPLPHFLNYIAVDDVDETASLAFDIGGKIVVPPMDIPNTGRFCIIQDPTGATFAVITLKSF